MSFRILELLFLAAIISHGEASGPVFSNVAKQSGINFHHCLGAKKISNIVEATGSGCAWFDYDGDGNIDLYVVNGCYLEGVSDPRSPFKGTQVTSHLYHNNGNGKFTDVTEKAGVGNENRYGMGCLVGDYDNDGHPDLFITNYGRSTLYHNNGNGTFTDVTESG